MFTCFMQKTGWLLHSITGFLAVGMPMDASISAHDLHTGRNMQKEHKPDSW
jgi:hypothetical protein